MLSNLNIRIQILGGFALVLLLAMGMSLPVVLHQVQSISGEAVDRQLDELYTALMAAIDAEGLRAETLSALLAGQEPVQAALARRDRDALMALSAPLLKHLRQEYDIYQLHYHIPPATSLLRVHRPDRYGDDMSDMRQTLVVPNRDRVPVRGLEVGVFGLGLRGVVPVSYRGEHAGSVEFGFTFGEEFFQAFKTQYGIDVALHLREKDGFDRFASTLGEQTLLTSAELERAFSLQTVSRQTTLQGEPVTLYGRVVNDFSGAPMGVVEMAVDRTPHVQAYQTAFGSIAGIALIAVLLGAVVALLIARSIIQPLQTMVTRFEDIAHGEGDLTQRLEVHSNNELGRLGRAFNQFAEKIQRLVQQMGGASSQLAAAAEQLSATSDETSRQVKVQQSETEQVAAAMNEMAATVQEVAHNAAEAAAAAQNTDQQATNGQEVVGQTVSAIEALSREVENTAEAIQRLSHDSEAIGSVLDVIRGIAEQTNLLALNAAIEAARAGEQGRGFAVVADEVRTLAQRTQSSTREIQEMIERLQAAAGGAVQAMELGRDKARGSVEQAAKAGDALHAITGGVSTISEMNTQIASAAEEQSAVAEEINRNVATISHAVDQTTAGADQIARASEELARLATELQGQIGQFKV